MGGMAFDGIYGEADTWLPAEEVAFAQEVTAHIGGRPPDIDGLRDLDEYRFRRGRI